MQTQDTTIQQPTLSFHNICYISFFTLFYLYRIGNHLKADIGKDWHDKLPKRDDINWHADSNINKSSQIVLIITFIFISSMVFEETKL